MVRWWFFSFPPVSTHTHSRNVPFASGCAYCANICHIMISFLLLWLLLLLLFVKLFRFLRHGFVIMCLFVHHGTALWKCTLFCGFPFGFSLRLCGSSSQFTITFFDSIECVCTRLFFQTSCMKISICTFFSLSLLQYTTCMTFCSEFIQL